MQLKYCFYEYLIMSPLRKVEYRAKAPRNAKSIIYKALYFNYLRTLRSLREMSNTLFGVLSILIILIFLISRWTSARKTSVLLITGGHSYDTIAFTGLFTQMKGIKADTMMQPRANQAIAAGLADRYDVIVFYDMWQTVTDAEKEGYIWL